MNSILINMLFILPILNIIFGMLLADYHRKIFQIISVINLLLLLILSTYIMNIIYINNIIYNQNIYLWYHVNDIYLYIGILIDKISIFMIEIISIISLLVHIYSISYMKDDKAYRRFFIYISLFILSMFILVLANNFLTLFFGWELVGLVSYLLIGLYFKKNTANEASFKAFLINRFADLWFLLGISLILIYFHTLDYVEINHLLLNYHDNTVINIISFMLLIGAIAKSAQFPLHMWLEGSMEAPTPVSALLHAATMVTAGIFLITRMFNIFEYSPMVLHTMLILGTISIFFIGFIACFQNDIKRILAYSTISQLGYMLIAEGISNTNLALFHLMTHAFFKALLFLSIGSIIISLHHNQNIKYMGGLKNKLPITYICTLIGLLSLTGIPPFCGFFSKDVIIEHLYLNQVNIFIQIIINLSSFITSLYAFRLFFHVFHGEYKGSYSFSKIIESSFLIKQVMIILSIFSMLIGIVMYYPIINYNIIKNYSNNNIIIFILHGIISIPTILSILGIFVSWFLFKNQNYKTYLLKNSSFIKKIYTIILNKYYIDEYLYFFIKKMIFYSSMLIYRINFTIIYQMENKILLSVKYINKYLSVIHTGYIYHYAYIIIIGLILILGLYLI
jgi:NADH-quinone oxidoreductase subunit L